MSGNYFHMVLQNNFKRNGGLIKQIWEIVKEDNKLIEIGNLCLSIFVFLLIHSLRPTQIHSLDCLAPGGRSICSVN